MPMSRSSSRPGRRRGAWRDDAGTAVVELAFALPVLVLLFGGMVEIGRAYYHANSIERGLRAGAIYAARSALPLSVADRAVAANLVKTGTLDGNGALLASGWSEAAADLDIDTSKSFTVDDQTIPVIALTARVPFDPIFPSLLAWLDLTPETIVMRHEQAWIGN